jgi:hypothetical protein
MTFLRQSTASQTRILGPFVDDTDFKTLETGLTIANTDVKLMANGGSSANKNSGGGTHRVNGNYAFTFDATDTATIGELSVSISVAGALPVAKTFFVLEEAVFDMLFGASALGYINNAPVSVADVTSSALDAIRDRVAQRTTLRGTVGSSSTTTSIVTSAMSPATTTADQLKGRIVIFDHNTTTAALRGQATDITASSASGTPVLTVTALTTAPVSGDTFTIV